MLLATEIRRAFCSRYFFLGFIVCMMGLLFSGGSDLIDSIYDANHYDAYTLFDFAYLKNNAIWFFYIGSAIPFAASYIQDKESGYIRFLLSRTSLIKFAISRFFACAIAGGTVTAISCLIFWILCLSSCSSILPADNIPSEAFLEMGSYSQLLEEGNLIIHGLLYFGAQFLYGAFWASIGLSLSAVSAHSYIAYVMPLLAGLMLVQINVITEFPSNLNPIFISQKANLGDVWLTTAWIITFYAFYLIVLLVIFALVLNRRWSNG